MYRTIVELLTNIFTDKFWFILNRFMKIEIKKSTKTNQYHIVT